MDVRLVDWKRTANLDRKYVNPWRSLAAPLEHLADAQGVKYRLQLNLYRYILETYCQYIVSAMLVVCVHPDLEAPFIDEVPHMPAETCAIMRLRRQAVANHAEISPTFPLDVAEDGDGEDVSGGSDHLSVNGCSAKKISLEYWALGMRMQCEALVRRGLLVGTPACCGNPRLPLLRKGTRSRAVDVIL